jgi:peptidoglycan/LPS O-acetylase OafA/YrhL
MYLCVSRCILEDVHMAGERWRLGHRPGLDGLRGIAILLVLAAHVGGSPLRSFGPAGVTLFFVLSGFLITSLLLEEHHRTGKVTLAGFYARRARRLFPALAVMLVFVAFVYEALRVPLRNLLPVVFYVGNWRRAGGFDIPLLGHTWSLAIEEQFYFVWPIVLLAALRWGGKRAVLVIATLGVVASVVLRFALATGGGREDRVWFGTDTNAFALLAGCALAVWMSTRSTAGRNHPRVAALLVALVAVVGLDSSTSGLTFVSPLFAAATGVILLVLLCQGGDVGIFGSPVLRFVGRRSYGYYLWHVPILLLLETYLPTMTARMLVVPLTVMIAEMSWRFVEVRFLVVAAGVPSRRRRRPVTDRPSGAVGDRPPALR